MPLGSGLFGGRKSSTETSLLEQIDRKGQKDDEKEDAQDGVADDIQDIRLSIVGAIVGIVIDEDGSEVLLSKVLRDLACEFDMAFPFLTDRLVG